MVVFKHIDDSAPKQFQVFLAELVCTVGDVIFMSGQKIVVVVSSGIAAAPVTQRFHFLGGLLRGKLLLQPLTNGLYFSGTVFLVFLPFGFRLKVREGYQQIRSISDRLCREHGLSVIVQGVPARSVSYIEWLRQSKGQPTFRSMLETDLRDAIRDANDLGHFFLLMEHKGYEIHHVGRLGFRLRGQERFQYPGRRDPLFREDGIRAAIAGNLEQIEA